MAYEFKIPSLGEGVTGKVLDVLVKPGDQVKKDQTLLVIGTDKVDADIPADAEGTVEEVLVKKGDDVTEGAVALRLKTAASNGAPADSSKAPEASTKAASPKEQQPIEKQEQTAAAPEGKAPESTPVPAPASSEEFKIPSLGEGVTGKVLDVLVKAGDAVKKDQTLFIIGTDKVDAEIPAEADGTVEEVLVKKGEDVKEGAVALRLKTSGGAQAVSKTSAPPAEKSAQAAPQAESKPQAENKPQPEPAPEAAAPKSGPANLRVSPLARKRARELGVNIADVRPAEGASRISYKDVVDFVKKKIDTGGGSAAGGGSAMPHKPLPDFSKYGEIERQAQGRIGVLTAQNMHYAFNTIPHAWISEKADITQLEQLRQQYKEQVKTAGGNLTTTAIVAKAVSGLLRKMPQFNASYDAETQEIIFKKYVNVGIAVDTPRGLLVPVIRNTDQKGLQQIAIDLTEISGRTRDGKNKPDDLDGGTFTISNIGGIGGTNMISIVNWPQVAILSITAAQMEAQWNEQTKAFEPRLMMPMTIGWDHRVINGADAARFLVELKKILEEPFLGWM